MEEKLLNDEKYIIHKVRNNYSYKVFKNIHNGKTFYKIPIEQTLFDEQKIVGYVNVKFPQNVEVEDGAFIKINQAIENFYFNKNDIKHYTPIFYYQILDFEIVNKNFEEYSQSLNDTDMDLPF